MTRVAHPKEGQPIPKPVKAPKKPRKRLPHKSTKKIEQQSSAQGQEDAAHIAAMHDLPCCICEAFGFVQTSPTEAHHIIYGRFSGIRTPDKQAIPLCRCHHLGDRHDSDPAKLAIHKGQESWVEAYGPDTDYIAATLDKIERLAP